MSDRAICAVEGCTCIVDAWGTGEKQKFSLYCQKHRKLGDRRWSVIDDCDKKPEPEFREDGRQLCTVLGCHRVAKLTGIGNPLKTCDYHGRGYHQKQDRLVAKRHNGRMRRYGITTEQYDELMEAQGGLCCICGEPAKAVDHNHDTGVVRGILCTNCNAGLGLFKESITILRGAMAYVRKHAQVVL